MAVCYTDNPEGFEQCLSECKVYPIDSREREECEEACYLKYCAEDPAELEDFTDEMLER
mgnify:FL=1